MIDIFFYALKTSVPVGFFFIFYWLFLRNEKLFGLNRTYILFSLFLSFSFPIVKAMFPVNTQIMGNVYEIMPVTLLQSGELETHNTNSVIHIISILYIVGTLVFATRFLFRLSHIVFLFLRHKGVKMNGFQPVYVKGNQSPFTFFNLLFLPSDSVHKNPVEAILDHERVHFEQLHTVDNLLLELAIVFQWFNPIIWLYKAYLGSVHEFMADKRVLEKGYNKAEYQKLMVESSTGLSVAGLSSHFNATLLKKRIIMMSNYKSNHISYLKYFFALPVFVISLLFLTPDSTTFAQTDDKVFSEVDVMPEYPGGLQEARAFIGNNIDYPATAKKAGVEAKVYVNFVVNEKGQVVDVSVVRSDVSELNDENEVVVVAYKGSSKDATIDEAISDLEAEAVRVIAKLENFKPGEYQGKKVKVQYTFPITFALN